MTKLAARSPEMVRPRCPTVVVYGEAGVGKTFAALDFRRPYFIDTESGATLPEYVGKLEQSGGAYFGSDEGALDFQVVLGQIEALTIEEHDFETLVIDSFSKLFGTAVAAEWDRKHRRGENMSSTYGAEKKPAINLTRQLIRRLDRLDMTTLLICHETTAWQNGQVVGTTFDGWEKLTYELDLVLNVVANGSQRLARIIKSRMNTFQRGAAFPWNYDELSKRLDTSCKGA